MQRRSQNVEKGMYNKGRLLESSNDSHQLSPFQNGNFPLEANAVSYGMENHIR